MERIHIETLLANAEDKRRTQQQILLTFSAVLKSAVSDKLLAANVADDILRNTDKIKYKPSEKRPLTPAEKKAVFDATYKYDSDQAYVYLIYGCGLRREECVALTIFDFVLKRREVPSAKPMSILQILPGVNGSEER